MRSMFGVFMYGWPPAPNSSKRRSSIRITRKFGLRGTYRSLRLDGLHLRSDHAQAHTQRFGLEHVLREDVRDIHVGSELAHEKLLHVLDRGKRDAADPRSRQLDQHLRHVERAPDAVDELHLGLAVLDKLRGFDEHELRSGLEAILGLTDELRRIVLHIFRADLAENGKAVATRKADLLHPVGARERHAIIRNFDDVETDALRFLEIARQH